MIGQVSFDTILREKNAAIVKEFALAFGQVDLAHETATKFTCGEIESFSALLYMLGLGVVADTWVAAHSLGDSEIEGDYPEHLEIKARELARMEHKES